MQEENNERIQSVLGFNSFAEVLMQYPNAVDLSQSDKRKLSYQEVTQYLKSIVDDVMVTADGDKIAISDDYRHIEEPSDYAKLNRRGKEEIKTFAAEVKELVAHSYYEKEIPNRDPAKKDVEKFKYYSVPVWINNRAFNVLLECGQLKNETSISATRKGASNDTYSEVSKIKYIRKHGKLQVLDVSYLYNIRNRPLHTEIPAVNGKIKGAAYDSPQVAANPMTEHGSSHNSNLPHSLEKSITKQSKPPIDLEKKLYERATVIVDGKHVVCKEGLLKGFCDEHRKLEAAEQKINELSEQIERLTQNRSVSRDDDGWDY